MSALWRNGPSKCFKNYKKNQKTIHLHKKTSRSRLYVIALDFKHSQRLFVSIASDLNIPGSVFSIFFLCRPSPFSFSLRPQCHEKENAALQDCVARFLSTRKSKKKSLVINLVLKEASLPYPSKNQLFKRVLASGNLTTGGPTAQLETKQPQQSTERKELTFKSKQASSLTQTVLHQSGVSRGIYAA